MVLPDKPQTPLKDTEKVDRFYWSTSGLVHAFMP